MNEANMYHFGMLRVAGVLLGATVGMNMACLTSANRLVADTGIRAEKLMMYDFRTMASVDNWRESSDTVREPGMSKGAFEIQKSRLFQRAVFFSMLNPQPNGAGFVGFYVNDGWNLSNFNAIELKVRGQGQNYHYKVNFRHKGDSSRDGITYEAFYEIPAGEWTTVKIPFDEFKPYFRGRLIPDAEPLDTSDITTTILQIVGGVYSDFKQHGTSSLEIDYIQAVV